MRLWAPRVLGLDLSLTGTGIARIGNGVELLRTVRPGKGVIGHARLQLIMDAIHEAQHTQDLDMVVIEGPSYGSQAGQRGHHERAGLWWLVTHGLYARGRPYAVAPPTVRAKYATGDGRAGKAAVLAAVRRDYGHHVDVRDDNQADALVLATMGVDRLGGHLAGVPVADRTILHSVAWPASPADD